MHDHLISFRASDAVDEAAPPVEKQVDVSSRSKPEQLPRRDRKARLRRASSELKVSQRETKRRTRLGSDSELDPAAEAAAVATDWRGGWEAIIRAGVRIEKFLRVHEGDDQHINAFIDQLVQKGVLTPKDAQLGVAKSSKLSKLRTIGRHEALLCRPEVARYLEPSYSTIYAIVQLSELPGVDGEDDKGRLLVDELKHLPSVNRANVEERIAQLVSEKAPNKTLKNSGSILAVNNPAAPTQTLAALIEARSKFGLAALDVRELGGVIGADYAPGSSLMECLPLRHVTAQEAAVVILARVSDIPAIAMKLLPACGFPRPSHVFLLRAPVTPEIIKAEVIVAASRGSSAGAMRGSDQWLEEGVAADLLAIADRLYPTPDHKLHAFADVSTEGWTCLVGNDSWTREPTVR